MAVNDPASATNRWHRFREDLAVLLWAAFLAACIATMLFFAYIDPELFAVDETAPAWLADRQTCYAVGFFFFWVVCAIASFLTAYLIGTRGSDRKEP